MSNNNITVEYLKTHDNMTFSYENLFHGEKDMIKELFSHGDIDRVLKEKILCLQKNMPWKLLSPMGKESLEIYSPCTYDLNEVGINRLNNPKYFTFYKKEALSGAPSEASSKASGDELSSRVEKELKHASLTQKDHPLIFSFSISHLSKEEMAFAKFLLCYSFREGDWREMIEMLKEKFEGQFFPGFFESINIPSPSYHYTGYWNVCELDKLFFNEKFIFQNITSLNGILFSKKRANFFYEKRGDGEIFMYILMGNLDEGRDMFSNAKNRYQMKNIGGNQLPPLPQKFSYYISHFPIGNHSESIMVNYASMYDISQMMEDNMFQEIGNSLKENSIIKIKKSTLEESIECLTGIIKRMCSRKNIPMELIRILVS